MRFIVYYSIPYFVILTLNIELDASRIVDVICLTAFVSMVNAFIPVPGASGGTEITFVTVFAPLVGEWYTISDADLALHHVLLRLSSRGISPIFY